MSEQLSSRTPVNTSTGARSSNFKDRQLLNIPTANNSALNKPGGMKTASTIFQWLIVLAFILAIPYIYKPVGIVILALCCAFTWVEKLHWGKRKPFTCTACLSGWFALVIGCIVYGWYGVLFLPVGLMVGSLFEVFKMRHL
jgi:hypothetical protein